MTRSLVKLRRRAWFVAACNGGVVAIETPLTGDGRRWNVHAHAILGVNLEGPEREAWIERAAREWSALVGPGALWSCEDLLSRNALARYACKVGAHKTTVTNGLPPRLAAHLDQALHRRRLVRSWRSRVRKEKR
jgi:hypothetical protein